VDSKKVTKCLIPLVGHIIQQLILAHLSNGMGQLIPFFTVFIIVLEFVTLSKLVFISCSKTLQDQTVFSFSSYAYKKLKQALQVKFVLN